MPFGLKQTKGISDYCSEAWAIAPRLGAEMGHEIGLGDIK